MSKTISLPSKILPFMIHFLEKKSGVFLACLFLAAILDTLLFLSFSTVLKNLVDKASVLGSEAQFSDFYGLITSAGALLMGYAAVNYMSITGWQKGRLPFELSMRRKLFGYVQQQSHQYFADHMAGHVAQKVMEIPHTSAVLIAQVNYHILPAMAVILFSIFWFAQLSAVMAVACFIWGVIYIALTLYFVRGIARDNRKRSRAKGLVSGSIVDSFSNNHVVRLFSRRGNEAQYVSGKIDVEEGYTLDYYKKWKMMSVIQKSLLALFFFCILSFATSQFVGGVLSAGGLAMVTSLLLIISLRISDFGEQLIMTAESVGSMQDGIALINKPISIVDHQAAKDLDVQKGQIDYRDVSFGYGLESVLDHFNLTIVGGQKVGFVGQSGVGKSTVVSLLLRLYDLQDGEIVIDGQDISATMQDSLRRSMAVIPQETSLFHRSLIDNIRYGQPDASDEDVIEAAKKANAHEFIKVLPEGYETLVGERGVKLSGGQRQRIAIARAILKDAPILVLDEATSALDSESEKLIQESLVELMKGKTVIAIAHRLSTIAHLDRLIVMDAGKIIEDGSHDDLLAKDGVYATLWNMQSGGFLTEK